MNSNIKALWTRLFGARESGGGEEPSGAVAEHNGFRIEAVPYAEGGQYQTAGVIRKDMPDGVREYRFVRAEKHGSREEAVAFSLAKGRQIVDEQGERLFKP